jgi:cbb3-type cytochrome oxidase cytochrome c subunit
MNKPKMLLCYLSLAFLAMATRPPDMKYSHLRTSQIAGKELFVRKACTDCHTLKPTAENDLTPVSNKRSDEWFADHLNQESKLVLEQSTSARKQRRILAAEIAALDDYLYGTPAEQRSEIDGMAANVYQGAFLTYQNNCLRCHAIAGMGNDDAPALTYVADKHSDPDWLMQNLVNPKQFTPETTMPTFDHLAKEQRQQIIAYLLTLKK